MSDETGLIVATVNRILQDLCTSEVVEAAEAGTWPEKLWQALEETGLTLAGVGESAGGSGGEVRDSITVIMQAARFAAPVPLGETFMAAKLLEFVGAAVPSGPLTVSPRPLHIRTGAGGPILAGVAPDVPFASRCQRVVLAAEIGGRWKLCCVPPELARISQGRNMAGEDRSSLDFDGPLAEEMIYDFAGGDPSEMILAMGALTRAVMMAGALESVLEMSIQYALQREQFGRPIAKFQAIQQQLALLAGEVAVCRRAADAAAERFMDLDPLEVAVAKARIGEAVNMATDIAHQVHGAMGYTMEHGLNLRTRRLWCWRDEYGNETFWQKRLGTAVADLGADNLWKFVAATG